MSSDEDEDCTDKHMVGHSSEQYHQLSQIGQVNVYSFTWVQFLTLNWSYAEKLSTAKVVYSMSLIDAASTSLPWSIADTLQMSFQSVKEDDGFKPFHTRVVAYQFNFLNSFYY